MLTGLKEARKSHPGRQRERPRRLGSSGYRAVPEQSRKPESAAISLSQSVMRFQLALFRSTNLRSWLRAKVGESPSLNELRLASQPTRSSREGSEFTSHTSVDVTVSNRTAVAKSRLVTSPVTRRRICDRIPLERL